MNQIKIKNFRSSVTILSLFSLILLSSFSLPTTFDKGVPSGLKTGEKLPSSYFSAMFPLVNNAYAEQFILRINKQVFFPGDDLVVYGKGAPNDVYIFRLFDASDRAVKIDTVQSDNLGTFRKSMIEWPEPTRNFAFGAYRIEMSSSLGSHDTRQLSINFAEGATQEENNTTTRVPVTHILSVKLDSPLETPVGKRFRVFVQVTYDGALVDSDPSQLLGTSHIHLGNTGNSTSIDLADSFKKLHEGLYYADVSFDHEGSYVIHASAFYNGYLSHDSKVISASKTTINTVQDSVNNLNSELKGLQLQLTDTRSTLNDTGNSITDSLSEAKSSIGEDIQSAENTVNEMKEASGQINSIILPVLALISIIIALQISLFARIRASYK